ncbi:MAG: acyl-CoA/acyl-ACP dehydrogenase, partial [Alphaproteobacteria bacterium]|nr:acyl-CoA/acyl-ACP dehydrogenase [Alphaproteobacteria bacterium]
MNFDFSDDQRMLRDQARKFLTDQSPPRVVRAVLEDDSMPCDKALWDEMAILGWMGTTIPEEFGGAGLCPEDLCVLAEELGRSLAPTPFSSSVYLATEAILMAGSDEQKQAYLPDMAMGERIGCFAIAEGIGAPTPKTIAVVASNGVLNGVKEPVADGDVADFTVVLARTGGADERGLSLFLVDLNEAREIVARLAKVAKTNRLIVNKVKLCDR